MKKNIFILAGEASGDLHASILVRGIRELDGGLSFSGVGGPKMSDEGVSLLYDCTQFSSMGIVEPLLKLRFYRNALKNILNHISEKNIDTVILVDYPGFNLHLAGRIKKKLKVKIIYYVSPQIWAWNYSRIKKIKKYIDAMIVFYPFEHEMYSREGVRSFFLGNPLVDIVADNLNKADELNIKIEKPCIALLPGSRVSELNNHLTILLRAAAMIKQKYNGTILLPVLKGDASRIVGQELAKPEFKSLNVIPVIGNTYRAIEKADVVITSSGTATLETAILEKPMIVIYKVGILVEALAKIIFKIDIISLVNIIAGKRICPELTQRNFNPERIYYEVCRIIDNKKIYNDMVDDIIAVKKMLGGGGAVKRISDKMLLLINE